MTVLLVTNDKKDLAGSIFTDSVSGRYDSAFVDDYIYCLGGGGGSRPMMIGHTEDVSSATEVWFHWDQFMPDSHSLSSDGDWLRLRAPDGSVMAYMDMSNGNTIPRVYNAAGSSTTGTGFMLSKDALETYDFRYSDNGTTCEFEMFVNGISTGSVSQASAGGKNMPNKVTFMHSDMVQSTSAQICFSQIILTADESTIGMKMEKLPPNAVGNYNDMSATVAEINDADPSTGWSSGTNGDKQSYTHPTYTMPAGRKIFALLATCNMRVGLSGPQNIRNFVRIGSTDYNASADKTPVAHQYGVIIDEFPLDPATGLLWTAAGITAAEVGFEVKT